jgi:hypothetical protein
MKTIRTMAATTAALSMLATQAWAAGCTGERDALALKTAAVQQELMVAAFTCGDTDGYNRFVTSYQPDLQASDAILLAYFQRTGSTADYHTYKTSLANDFSLISVRNNRFCSAANTAFNSVLDPSHPALAQIVEEQPVTVNEDGDTCGGVSVASADTAMLPHEDELTMREPRAAARPLPHESDMAAPDSQGEAVSGGSWDGERVAGRAPN